MENKEIKNEIKSSQVGQVNDVKEEETKALKLYLERESFEGKNGETYFAYFVKAQIRKRDIKIDFLPKDKGGYVNLDLIFEIAKKNEIIMTKGKITDSATGAITEYTSYKVVAIDENGIPFDCDIKPSQPSDKSLLSTLLAILEKTGA